MPRLDRRLNGLDVIRFVENNLRTADKRLVFAWFYALIPVKEPKVDALQLLLDLLGVIPVVGSVSNVFQVSIATAQVAKDIADLFGFEFEEEEVELARLRMELQSLTEEFRLQRDLLLRTQVDLDNANERIAALLATQELLEDEVETTIVKPGNLEQLKRDIEFVWDRIDNSTGPCGLFLLTTLEPLRRLRIFFSGA